MVDVLKLDTARLLDPRLSLKQSGQSFNTNMGAAQVNYRRQSSNSSSGNTSNITFNPVINTTSIIDRKILTEVYFNLKFTGTSGSPTQNLLKEGYDAPRSLGSIVSNCQLSINTQSITQESRFINNWLCRFEDMERMKNALTLAPQMAYPDQTQSYEEAEGSNFNSLAGFTGSDMNRTGRGMYRVEVLSNTTTSAEVNLILYDYVYLSPMVYDNEALYQGIPNVSSLELTYTLQQIQRIWCHSNAGGSAITNIEVAIPQAWLNFTELTPPPQVQIPPSVLLPYHEIERRLTNCNVSIPAQSSSKNLFSQTYTLNTVPLKAVVIARERQADFSTLQDLINKPDVYGAIKNISIQYANQTALFSTASQEVLYSISQRNGYQGSFEAWSGKTQINTAWKMCFTGFQLPTSRARQNQGLLAMYVRIRVHSHPQGFK